MDKLAEWTCCSRVSQWLWRSAAECTSGIVLIRQWSAQPPASFAFIQKGAGVPLQRFWIPVHTLITIGEVASLIVELESRPRRSLVIAALKCGNESVELAYFIPEMLRFRTFP